MSYDLKSKLQMYKSSDTKSKKSSAGEERDIDHIMDGRILNNDNGSCFLAEKHYPLSYLHGGFRLDDAIGKYTAAGMDRLYSGEMLDLAINDFLFLDTETTGLSGGTGTVAFLIGAGFFSEDSFVLRQYLIRDYNEEPSMLEALNEDLTGKKGLVTFNGKSFDWNLLQTRFIFNRMRPVIKEPVHIDLLYPSRKIWKLKLSSCRLSSLEENVLSEYRVDDIPGAEIPGIYFKYLEDRDATLLKKVLEHNEKDILSMVSLLARICTILENPLSESADEHELLGAGRIFENSREYDRVIDCFEECMKSRNITLKEAAARRLTGIYKKNKNYAKAVEHWKAQAGLISGEAAESSCFSIYPLIELAKYYEHREKNIPMALEMVEKAVRLSSNIGYKNNIYHEDLSKRLNRLRKKAGRVNNA